MQDRNYQYVKFNVQKVFISRFAIQQWTRILGQTVRWIQLQQPIAVLSLTCQTVFYGDRTYHQHIIRKVAEKE